MSKVTFFGLMMIGYFLFLFYTIDVGNTLVTSNDNDDAVEMATRTAVSQSINRGHLRVYEEMTLDPEVAEAAFLRSYAKNVGHNDVNTLRKVEIYGVSENPPMLAVDVTTATNGLTKNYLTNWNEYVDDQNNYTNERHIVIYEAKSTTKPPQGGVSE
jgi:Flp pilus assembly protein TadG